MLKTLFGATTTEEDKAPKDALRLAFAVLLVEAARADEHYEEAEKTIIDRLLRNKFELPPEEARALRGDAEAAQAEALDIQQFTKEAKTLNDEEKLEFIEGLWEIVLSDDQRDPYEDTLIRRICGLIYVEDRESAIARKRALARLQQN